MYQEVSSGKTPAGEGSVSPALTPAGLDHAVEELAARDPDFAGVVDRWGTPPLWDRDPGFATLVHVILEQQVSLASAAAAMDRLVETIGRPEPSSFLALDDAELLRIGFSRQKRRYARDLAERMSDGRLDLSALEGRTDAAVREQLMEVKGVGVWTADVYLLMVLLRPDIWPAGDRALVIAARVLKRLDADPDREAFEALGEGWRPFRSVAARLLWHFYLNEVRVPGGRAE